MHLPSYTGLYDRQIPATNLQQTNLRPAVKGESRLHDEELNDLYCSPTIVRVIKSRRMRWAGNVARMGEVRGCIGSWRGNRKEREH